MKISLITIVYNAADTIENCIRSVISQSYHDVEYIIIDGGSTDDTLRIIDRYRSHISILVSGPDQGIYDAMNKGISLASGLVIGTLNADDFFAGNDVLAAVAGAFIASGADIVYGNLHYISPANKTTRIWRGGQCGNDSFNWGFMPPHPTFYCKRILFEKLGFYSLEYGSAGDYELMVRFMHRHKIKSYYLDKVMVLMMTGGVSNSSIINRLKAWKFDLKAMRKNKVFFPLLALVLKPVRKLGQWF